MKTSQFFLLKISASIFLFFVSLTTFSQSPGGVSTNLSLWLKADNVASVTGSPVQAWATSGGSAAGYSVTQATAGNRPAIVNGATNYTSHNYNPRIKFTSASSTKLFNTAIAPNLLGSNGTAIIVTTQEAVTGFTYRASGVTSSPCYQLKPNFRFQTGNAGTGYTFDWGAPTEYPSTSASMICSYGCAATAALRKNSVQATVPNNTAALYNPSISSGLYLGANNGSEYSNHSVAEVILFNAKPTLAEMDRVETYLAIKYGITRGGNTNTTALYNYVASDGATVVWDKTTNAGYNNDIAGIGRDDNSVLNQKQSISVNNGEALTVSLGTTLVPLENSTNAATFTSNTNFLVWGNNALAKTFNTGANKPAGIVERLDRIWKLQNTNITQQVAFGFETAQVTGGTIGTLCLLFDDDGNFSNATVVAACTATNTGTRIEFKGVSIPAGLPYMTLARVQLPTFASNNGPICEGTALNLTAESVAASTYSWSGPNTFTAAVQNPTINPVTAAASGIYTVTANSYGCITNLTTNAIVNPTVVPSVIISSTSPTICAGAPVSFTATPTNGGTTPTYQWQVNGVNAGTGSIFSSSTLINGDQVTAILTSNANCVSPATATSNTITITVSVLVAPSVINTASSNTICIGSNATFTATPNNGGTLPTYQWQVNGVNAGTGSMYSSTVLANGDVVSVVLTSNSSCASPTTATSNSITMTVNPNVVPSVTIAASTTTICAGSNVSFTATPTNGGTSPTYQWKVNGVNAGTGVNYSSSTLNNGDVVSVVLTSNANCAIPTTVNSNSITITVNPALIPSVSNAASTNTICAGTNVSFTATPTNGGASPTYQWQLNGSNVGTGSTYSSSGLTNGDVVSVVLTSNAVCATPATANSNSITITVNPNVVPTVSISASTTTICAGNPVSFTATPTNGGTTPTYQWKVNGVNAGTGSTLTSSVLNNGDQVTAILTSNANCVSPATANSNTITIIVNAAVAPTVSNATSTTTICAGSNVSFTATPTNGGTLPTYQWKVNGVNVGTSSIYSSSGLANGDVVSVVLTSNSSCASPTTATSNSITITVNPNVVPTVSISASTTTICAGNPVSFTATPTNGGTTPSYQWQVNGSNTGTGSTFTSSTLNNGDQVTAILTSNANCAAPATASSNTITITVNAAMAPTVSNTASTNTICAGTNVSFTATPTNGGTTPTYQWQLNGANVGTGSTYSSSGLNNGDVVSVVLTSNAACATPAIVNSNSVTMTVNPTLVPSVINAASNTTICAGTNVTFTATPTNGGTTPTYQWLVNGISAGTGSTFSSSTLNNTDVVSVILTSNAVCTSPGTANSNSITIGVTNTVVPSVSSVASTTSICSGTAVNFTASPTNGGTAPAYQWQVNGANSGTGSVFSSAGLNNNDVITVVMTSNAQCAIPTVTVSNPISMSVTPSPTAAFSYSPTELTEMNPDASFQNQSSNSTTWLWDFSVNGSTSTSQDPNFTFPGPGTYTVTLQAFNGVCTSITSQIITVDVISTYYIPNVFTPNGDSLNDYFSIVGHGISPDNFEMSIFNRWGSLIYNTKDIYAQWDGTVSGNTVQDGTYVYIFTFKLGNSAEIIKKAGNVNVFK